MKLVPACALAVALCAFSAVPPAAEAQPTQGQGAPACSPVGDLSFVCGLINVEDILPVGGRWLVGGSFQAGSAGLYLIDTAAKTAKPATLSIAARPDPIYAGCPAPDLKKLTTHGLDVAEGARGMATVFAINHGGRESVEVFHLNASKGSAEWVGCVVLPDGTSGNSIAHLSKGAFAVTKFLDTRDKQAFQHVMSGAINGVVYIWTPGKGFSELPGSQLSGDNGVLASPDGKWLYVNAYGTREVYRVPLSGKGERASVKVDFNPDNLRWAPDGKVFVTGQFINPKNPPGAHNGWATVRLDPQTMKTTPLVKEAGLAEFDNATSAVQVGDTLWFGTFRGDRVAYRPAP